MYPRRGPLRSFRGDRVSGEGRESSDLGIELHLLEAIERDSALTQRSLARDLGIALGLANAYLRRCVKKGLVKIRQAPASRYFYYLTPQGLAEKSRLVAEYLAVSLAFFRLAKSECAALFAECEARGWRRVALVGVGELAEIATLSSGERAVEILCVIDRGAAGRRCAGLPVVADLRAAMLAAGAAGLDALIVTDMHSPQRSFEAASEAARFQGLSADRIMAPRLLHLSGAPAKREGLAA
jgi:DNA-binding MarR family transcriptional regulator